MRIIVLILVAKGIFIDAHKIKHKIFIKLKEIDVITATIFSNIRHSFNNILIGYFSI
jgi:hypothetical protein